MRPLPAAEKQAARVAAVLALLQGTPVKDVTAQFQIGRSALYKFKHRALAAIRGALVDHPRGPRRSHNRTDADIEAQIVTICQRHPTFSAYTLQGRYGMQAPSPRTIQRIRARHRLGRFPRRNPPTKRRRVLTSSERQTVMATVAEKPYLGPERTAWDLQNAHQITVSSAMIKRLKRKQRDALLPPRPVPPAWCFYERRRPHSLWHGDFMEKVTLTDLDQTAYQFALQDDYSRGYVFCDLFLNPDARTTIRALIAAMRKWQVIPEAVVFDNGSPFKGRLLSAFCDRLGIRLIHASVNHPQTNGKLERAFRDDMRDFYQRYDGWFFDELRRDLPAYIYYRNHIRGHRALGGKPAITRLDQHTQPAPEALLNRLETYACYEIRRKVIPATGSIRMFGRNAHMGRVWANVEVTFFESLEGLEARLDGKCVAVLKNYRTFKQLLPCYWQSELPRALYFEPPAVHHSPRIAVAS